MSAIDTLTRQHRDCDERFAACEAAVRAQDWESASTAFAGFRQEMEDHFGIEEEALFPAFESASGQSMGPTRVMRAEHAQMRELLAAAGEALAAEDADDYAGNAETLLILAQQHNMKEENVLYPMCDQHLAAEADGLVRRLVSAIHEAR